MSLEEAWLETSLNNKIFIEKILNYKRDNYSNLYYGMFIDFIKKIKFNDFDKIKTFS